MDSRRLETKWFDRAISHAQTLVFRLESIAGGLKQSGVTEHEVAMTARFTRYPHGHARCRTIEID
jgi:hypothetical protein